MRALNLDSVVPWFCSDQLQVICLSYCDVRDGPLDACTESVGSVELSTFYQSVQSWSEQDLSRIAEAVAKLLGLPFVAVAGRERVGFRFGDNLAVERVDESALGDFLRKQSRLLDVGRGRVRHVQLGREGIAGALPLAGFHLAIVAISGNVRSETGASVGREREDFGFIVIGAPKALNSREEILTLAASQRLTELAEMDRLDNMLELRSQFLSIASHELKTPLTSIYGMLQLQERMLRLRRDEPVNIQQERQQSYLKIVIRQVERLNELIDGLLDVSRIQNGRFMVEPCDTDVAALLRDTASARLVMIAQEAGVSLHIEAPDQLLALVDPVRMEEVITNLVMNAIRFSPEGGVVWIRLRPENGNFRLTVRDQGPSVPSEDRERIFQPFERTQRTSRLGGLGLGLFISRQIAQLHGGSVVLSESVPGKGNVFEARFPTRTLNVISA